MLETQTKSEATYPPGVPLGEYGNHPIFKILYDDGREIAIYANGRVDGAGDSHGIVNYIPCLTDSILFGPEIPGESIQERYKRIVAPQYLHFSKSHAVASSPTAKASPGSSGDGLSHS